MRGIYGACGMRRDAVYRGKLNCGEFVETLISRLFFVILFA